MPKPTGSQVSFAPTSPRRCSRWQQLRTAFWDCGIFFHLALFVLTLASMVYSSQQSCKISSHVPRMLSERCLTHVAWPPAINLCYVVVTQCWIPLAEAILPTQRPQRESLLVRDSRTGVVYPSPQARASALKRTKNPFGQFYHYALIPASLLLVTIATLAL